MQGQDAFLAEVVAIELFDRRHLVSRPPERLEVHGTCRQTAIGRRDVGLGDLRRPWLGVIIDVSHQQQIARQRLGVFRLHDLRDHLRHGDDSDGAFFQEEGVGFLAGQGGQRQAA